MDPEMALNITVETEEGESENDEQLVSSFTILEKVH